MFEVIMTPADACDADMDFTGSVDLADLQSVIAQWGCTVACSANVDHTGEVTMNDLLLVLMAWGPCPTQ